MESNSVLTCVDELRLRDRDVTTRLKRNECCVWALMRVGLLYEGSGMNLAEIVRAIDLCGSRVAPSQRVISCDLDRGLP